MCYIWEILTAWQTIVRSAKRNEVLIRGLAEIGVIALVDEATNGESVYPRIFCTAHGTGQTRYGSGGFAVAVPPQHGVWSRI